MDAYEENKAAEIDMCVWNMKEVIETSMADFLWENWELIKEKNIQEFEDLMRCFLSNEIE